MEYTGEMVEFIITDTFEMFFCESTADLGEVMDIQRRT